MKILKKRVVICSFKLEAIPKSQKVRHCEARSNLMTFW